jgi:hypothetical protein
MVKDFTAKSLDMNIFISYNAKKYPEQIDCLMMLDKTTLVCQSPQS